VVSDLKKQPAKPAKPAKDFSGKSDKPSAFDKKQIKQQKK
jgi:hypothetical protein